MWRRLNLLILVTFVCFCACRYLFANSVLYIYHISSAVVVQVTMHSNSLLYRIEFVLQMGDVM